MIPFPITGAMPSLITGDNNITMSYQLVFPLNMRELSRIARGSAEAISFQTALDVGRVFQLIAKIAHGFVVANYGLDNFKPLLAEYILDPNPAIRTDLIGAVADASETEAINQVTTYSARIPNGLAYVMANIRLFACLGAPKYTVMVGAAHDGTDRIHPLQVGTIPLQSREVIVDPTTI
jgi:hypothetical protein